MKRMMLYLLAAAAIFATALPVDAAPVNLPAAQSFKFKAGVPMEFKLTTTAPIVCGGFSAYADTQTASGTVATVTANGRTKTGSVSPPSGVTTVRSATQTTSHTAKVVVSKDTSVRVAFRIAKMLPEVKDRSGKVISPARCPVY